MMSETAQIHIRILPRLPTAGFFFVFERTS